LKISGFSFVRNGVKLYYPVAESIRSILPICDEFVIAVGRGDEDDTTRKEIEAIGDPKIRILDTLWPEDQLRDGIIYAHQTDLAKQECSGDWLFYLQVDEAVHEKYLPAIRTRCEDLLNDARVEGLLFDYRHFWGDYSHFHNGHGWYPREIRIIRHHPAIHSYKDAQSFRHFEPYEGPRQARGTRKLTVAAVDAKIYHYGWVRPPSLMQSKRRIMAGFYWGRKRAAEHHQSEPEAFDYGPMDRLAVFEGTHPEVMRDRIARMDWQDQLQLAGKPNPSRKPHKHERFKNRLLSAIENRLLGGRRLGAYSNYDLLDGV